MSDELELRGVLAGLKCWHRLTGEEAQELVEFCKRAGITGDGRGEAHFQVSGPLHVVCQCDACKSTPPQQEQAAPRPDEFTCPLCYDDPANIKDATGAVPDGIQAVIDAARQWWCERTPQNWDDADLAKAVIRLDGDWPGCQDCDHDCDEPCMPATMQEQLRAVDCHIAQLVHEGKLHPSVDYKPPEGWEPLLSRSKRAAPMAVTPDGLIAAAKALDAMYVRAWDRTDGALWFSPESVEKFEAAHEALAVALKQFAAPKQETGA